MFGIDLGISVSSVSCVTEDNKLLDFRILLGNKGGKNEWKRVTKMAEHITEEINTISRSHPGIVISRMVAIEEPIYPYRTRNPRSYFNLSCLYALVRKKLEVRGFRTYSINPVSVKATARALAFKKKKLKLVYAVRGRLTKKGMIRAFKKVTGELPPASNNVGKETLADSFFIAKTAMERRRVGVG